MQIKSLLILFFVIFGFSACSKKALVKPSPPPVSAEDKKKYIERFGSAEDREQIEFFSDAAREKEEMMKLEKMLKNNIR